MCLHLPTMLLWTHVHERRRLTYLLMRTYALSPLRRLRRSGGSQKDHSGRCTMRQGCHSSERFCEAQSLDVESFCAIECAVLAVSARPRASLRSSRFFCLTCPTVRVCNLSVGGFPTPLRHQFTRRFAIPVHCPSLPAASPFSLRAAVSAPWPSDCTRSAEVREIVA